MIDRYPAELELLIARFAPGWPAVLDVGPRWYPLLVELHANLERVAPGYLVHQVKSKFGALDFYASPSSDPYEYVEKFRDVIDAARWRSTQTCEECGESAAQYVIGLWVWTVCPRHARDKNGASAE